MKDLIFACNPTPGNPEIELLLLVESLRSFGGRLADSPFWVLLPNGLDLPAKTRRRLAALSAEIVLFDPRPADAQFPFASRVTAAAEAERLAESQSAGLVWLDADTLILQEPAGLILAPGLHLACRPVHHRLIGSAADGPVDDFWRTLYAACGVAEERVFAVDTAAGEPVRAYFNAGLLAVTPADGLLRAWQETFFAVYQRPEIARFYFPNPLYRVFIHQTVLAAVALARTSAHQIRLLPESYNYPLHLHASLPPAHRAARLNDLVTARYDRVDLLAGGGLLNLLPVEEPLHAWLHARTHALRDAD